MPKSIEEEQGRNTTSYKQRSTFQSREKLIGISVVVREDWKIKKPVYTFIE